MADLSIFDSDVKSAMKSDNKESDFYTPTSAQGTDKVYSSIIKFLPNIFDPSKPFLKKWVVWVTNSETEESKNIDCPSTVKQPSLLQDAFFALRGSPSAQDQEISKSLGRRQVFYSLVYIVKDPHKPELNGKIKIMKFGKQVYDIIDNLVNSDDEPNNPWDIFNGRSFNLKIVEKSGYNNFNSSNFSTKVHSITIDGEAMTDSPKNRKKIETFLKENSPNILDYDYKPWDEATRRWVIEALESCIPSGKILDAIFKKAGAEPSTPIKKAVKSKKVEVEDDDEEEVKPAKKVAKPAPTVVLEEDDDDIDDLDSGLEDDDLDEILSPPKKTTKPVSKKASKVDDDLEDIDFDL